MDTTEVSLHLPEEIIGEILARLAAKSLLRFRCVSKSWLSLIGSKRFIKSHLQYSIESKDASRHKILIFLLGIYKPKQSNQCPLLALLEGTDLSSVCHPISPDPIGPNPLWYACCCNGLVCLYEGKRFLLINPTTRVSKELPNDPEIDNSDRSVHLLKIGFGWDESSGAYKVFAGWNCENKGPSTTLWYRCRVYSSKTNSWRTVEDPLLPRRGRDGKFVGGKLHWLNFTTNSVVIISFDVKSEVFGTIEPPVDMKSRYSVNLGVVGGCLCLSAEYYGDPKNTFDVWVMKESWEKLLTIHLVGEPLHELHSYSARVIGEAPNGEILIALEMGLLVYCPRDDVIRQRIKIGRYFRAHLCVESLVSPVMEITSLDI